VSDNTTPIRLPAFNEGTDAEIAVSGQGEFDAVLVRRARQ
jgi:hypothetical protein